MESRRPPRDSAKTRSMTSAEFIEQARQVLCLQELRAINTRRPETPLDEARNFFRQSSFRDVGSRPTSSSSISYCESRPSSNTRPRLPPLNSSQQKVRMSLTSSPTSPETVGSIKIEPRPPADPNRPLRRAGSRSRLLSQLSSLTSDIAVDEESIRNKSGSLTDGEGKCCENDRHLLTVSCKDASWDITSVDTARRVHSGPKERTHTYSDGERLAAHSPDRSFGQRSAVSRATALMLPEDAILEQQETQSKRSKNLVGNGKDSDRSCGTTSSKRVALAKQQKVPRNSTVSAKNAKQDVAGSSVDSQPEYYTNYVQPILDEIAAQTAENGKDVLPTLEDLTRRLYVSLEDGQLLGRNCRCRSTILHTIFRLLELNSPRLVLRVARLTLALDVTGTNLLQVCRKVNHVGQDSKNDLLFMEENFIDLLVETTQRIDHAAWPQILVYCFGSLKCLSDNSSIIKAVASKQNVEIVAEVFSSVVKTVVESGGSNEQLDLLLRLTGTLCNVANVSGASRQLLSLGVVTNVCRLMSVWSEDDQLMLLVSRILSKLTYHTDCCKAVTSDAENFRYFVELLKLHPKKLSIVLRVCYILGNLTAKLEGARRFLFAQPQALDTITNLLHIYSKQDFVLSEQLPSERSHSDVVERKKVEDVLVKVIRVIANTSITEDIGQTLSCSDAIVDLLLQLLEYKDIAVSEELVLNTIVTINNLSFYNVDNSSVTRKRLVIAELLLKFIEIKHPDSLAEVMRVLGNLSRERNVRDLLIESKIDEAVVAILDSGNRELVFAACGVLINLMVDEDKRPLLQRHNGISKLVDVLRDMGRSDWQLAGMVCQTLWNYSSKITSSNACFGVELSNELADLLTELLDEEALLEDADVDQEIKEYIRETWQSEFFPVASDLLARIESHQSQLEPLRYQ